MDFDALIQDYKPKKNPFRAPGFSFGYRSDEDTSKMPLSPGPGAYDTVSSVSSKHEGIKFTHSPRFDSKNTTGSIPGPGSYYKDTLDTTMNQSTATSKNGSSLASSKSHGTFSKAQRLGLFNSTSPLLGPGQYGVKRDFESLPQERKISKSKFDKISEHEKSSMLHTSSDTPGPGHYEVSKGVTSKQMNSSRFSMPQATRSFADVKQMADQGLKGDIYRYNKNDMVGKEGPKFSFGSGKRTELSPPSKSPGPSSYFPEVKDPRERYLVKGTFGQAPRKIGEGSKEAEFLPSPAEYQLDFGSFKKGAKISKSPKKSPEISKAPGPGQYDILDEFNEKKRALEKRLHMQQSLITARSPKHHRVDSESNDFSEVRESYPTEPGSPTSAGLRSPKSNALKHMWVEDIIKKSVSPGPMYMVQTDSLEANAGLMGTKFSTWTRPDFVTEALKKDTPGPGKYNLHFDQNETTQPVKFAVSKRKDNPVLLEYTLEIPGPEKYTASTPGHAYGGAFGKAERKLGKEEVLSPMEKLKKKKEINMSGNLEVIRE